MKILPHRTTMHIVCVDCGAIERLPAPSSWYMVKNGWLCGGCHARPLAILQAIPELAIPRQSAPEPRVDPHLLWIAAAGGAVVVVLGTIALAAYAWLS